MAYNIWNKQLSLRVYPDVVLRIPCDMVERVDSAFLDIVQEMFLLMKIHRGIGLAAPQVGISQRFFVAGIEDQKMCLINPVIEERSGGDELEEGCLSLPGRDVNVERASSIKVRSLGLNGKQRIDVFQGLWARVVQHETDHLNGILISDYETAGKNG